jgi:hypothetical protein
MDNITAACSKCKVKDKIYENEAGHGPKFCPTINKRDVNRAAMIEKVSSSVTKSLNTRNRFEEYSKLLIKTKISYLTRSDLWAYISLACKIFNEIP